MFIVPIQSNMKPAEILPKQEANEIELPFKDMLVNAIENVKDLDSQVKLDSYNLAMGNSDDLANMMINENKLSMAVELTTTITNKALNAYNEIMRMGI